MSHFVLPDDISGEGMWFLKIPHFVLLDDTSGEGGSC